MTKEELIKLFEKYEKETVPGTAYFNALCDFSKNCFDIVN